MIVGYARVSTKEQKLDMQLDALKKVGCERIFTEKKSGIKERPELVKCLASLREGDVFVVYRLDRIGRSLQQLVSIISSLSENKINFRSISDGIDTTTSMGRLQFGIFAALAQYEREIIRERTKAGLEAAKRRGKLGGRPKGLSKEGKKVAKQAKILYQDKQFTVDEISNMLRISKSTLYRYLRILKVPLRDKKSEE